MKLIDAVGRGSVREPRFVHISWSPKGAKKKLVFVGKGITFDTGGISIKPAAGMGEMKHDMSGAANVVGLMAAVAAVKPKVEVHAIAACAENMPDGNAYRPGDIWGSLDGKTVEIINTDAEGRLVLADALAYARDPQARPDRRQRDPHRRLRRRARQHVLGLVRNSERRERVRGRQKHSGETMWRMPLLEDLREQIKSDVADVKQAGDRWGGSITAALVSPRVRRRHEVDPLRHRRARLGRSAERLDAGQRGDGARRAHVPRHDRARCQVTGGRAGRARPKELAPDEHAPKELAGRARAGRSDRPSRVLAHSAGMVDEALRKSSKRN
jgi:hypothetical protein